MTTLREAAQQALVDMAYMRDMVAHPDNLQFIDKAITALRAALEQEPWVKSYCGGKPNYTIPAEPVAWLNSRPLYYDPPRREWRGLTEEEMVDIQDRCGVTILREEFLAIEQALKEKNA